MALTLPLHPSFPDRLSHRLRSRSHLHLFIDTLEVCFHGVDADVQFGSDHFFSISLAAADPYATPNPTKVLKMLLACHRPFERRGELEKGGATADLGSRLGVYKCLR